MNGATNTCKALFLDRDGVINIDTIDVYQIEDFKFIDEIFEVCHVAQERRYKIIVVTNQSGVSRGIYTEADVAALHKHMIQQFAERGIEIADVYTCTSHDNSHADRKPNPGMLLRAQARYRIDMARSLIVGDKERDILAGINAGCGKTILFTPDARVSTKADAVVRSLLEIVAYL
jgi:D-glycero-D-manno-heptose 1,7-bisphosphate phosphatase